MDDKNFKKYCEYSSKIDGWFGAKYLFAGLDQIQNSNNIWGDLFEIGVHHGKSALLMILLAKEGERFSCCDLFKNQGENKSRSGKGEKEIFYENLKKLFGEIPRNINIFDCNSSDLFYKPLKKNYRMFHIDGGHSFEETYSDLKLANSLSKEEGLIILDDYFNYRFPEVSEAITKSFMENKVDLVPVGIGKNKLVLCREDFHKFYLENMISEEIDYFKKLEEREMRKKKKFFGHEIVTFFGNKPLLK